MNTGSPVQDDAVAQKQGHPPIVSIVLAQAARQKMRGQITAAKCEAQVRRFSSEELEPRGLSLLVRQPGGGTMRFFVKDASTGRTREMIEIELDSAPLQLI
jgi:hypothetical protein